jgi:hypothetical protein
VLMMTSCKITAQGNNQNKPSLKLALNNMIRYCKAPKYQEGIGKYTETGPMHGTCSQGMIPRMRHGVTVAKQWPVPPHDTYSRMLKVCLEILVEGLVGCIPRRSGRADPPPNPVKYTLIDQTTNKHVLNNHVNSS